MARTAVLGLPRIGPDRELKFALESFWAGRTTVEELEGVARWLRAFNWGRAVRAGLDVIPAGDFSYYDQMLDTAWALGAIPARHGGVALREQGLAGYFALARGTAEQRPLEMTKWFDTNYHYLVPELVPDQTFSLDASHWVVPFREAGALGIPARPVVIGPFTFLKLAKGLQRPLELLDALVPVYGQLLAELAEAGAHEVQLDEPALVLDHAPGELELFERAFRALSVAAQEAGVELTLATYFAGLDEVGALERVLALGAAEVHLDLVRAPSQLKPALAALADGGAAAGSRTRLSLGVLDGRNVWAADLDAALDMVDRATAALGTDRITIAPSCSLLHVPYEAARETAIDPEVRDWLAFAAEKVSELRTLKTATGAVKRDVLLAAARESTSRRRTSKHTNDAAVRERVGALAAADYDRAAPFPQRRAAQDERRPLPQLPTTTIGSFPQTPEIRARRRELRDGTLDRVAYERFLEQQIDGVVEVQERLGLDVLVHGEPERNDMVEYFGEQLAGFAFSASGWVQSYGSRCVKPPILYGDVSRPAPMTVRWWQYAQSRTEKPVKGMLTGPVTILQWSFVRDDQPRSETATQIALAIQDEVLDLERAGAFAIQVDEAALREGLPLQRAQQDDYVRWAVDAFRLTVAPARNETQVHTHMCYSEFNDIMEHIVRLDADVISIEASRSDMEVLDAFVGADGIEYPNEIGPGVYDIHSPRVPSVQEIERLLELAEQRIGRERLWINPDCGLKTRSWDDVMPALEHLLEATRRRRAASPIAA
ncbi:5-methyltetrahydropteroyltriglutamate--homocysteine S-methyltransferase [Conexibacter sp. CPCC 206217]|uniref:5-methyltetrahydropteroyltriglutamate-- homocysteine S-methyltransferase n=1 Tax=Conexibacter sp. CPCC 206217 TaxID=3064574 RepID=UPI00271FA7F0|nr:5-methyltetrahydropteroyltriglutamate--homocysteine S-methyltransferase [Conexibacter sp. CPCC 206217]MDO8212196.1 5-methyltetrahydropteroyltriglutamate--homocysteine S-methyltransferase [Conexibacter sp. CPCC 206217]